MARHARSCAWSRGKGPREDGAPAAPTPAQDYQIARPDLGGGQIISLAAAQFHRHSITVCSPDC